MSLPRAFLDRPLAHRGLHDRTAGVIENSPSAFDAAVAAGYGIELDVQVSRDGVPMVFHDANLDRLTDCVGPVSSLRAAQLGEVRLMGGTDTIPTLANTLARIGDRAAVLVEIKDQSRNAYAGAALDQEVGRVLRKARKTHGCKVAVMSFNPQYLAGLAWLGDDIPRGITSCRFEDYDNDLPEQVRRDLAQIVHYDAAGASFVSHDRRDLDTPRIAALKAQGAAILCWTVRSAEEERSARRFADNITFERYRPA